jgi:hypothetical protein
MKDKVFVMVTTLGLMLTVGVLATIYAEQVFAVLPPEINSGRLTGQDAHIGIELVGHGFDVNLDSQHKPRGIDVAPTPFEVDVDAHTHQPRGP